MIVTRQNKIPFLWLIMVTVPWVLFYFQIQVTGLNFFILNRLIENPVTLTLILSLPGLLFTIFPLGAYISYMSDRIWTRWGRRKIFLIINFTGAAIVIFCYPLAPNIWTFVGLMFIASLIGSFGTPFEALKLEIVPADMRGRSGAINQWVNTIINIVFWGVVFGRFNEVMPVMGHQVSGTHLLFWAAAAGLAIVVFNYYFGIHEVQPKSTITGEKFNFKKAWQALSMPQLRYLYVFIIATAMVNTGLGVFGQLLYINQWGYSLQEMGFNVAVGGIINLFIIPIVGIFADRGQNHRMKLWIICLIIIKVLTIGAFAYYTWYLPDQRPSLVEIIFFGETTCIFGILAGMMYYPLVYDYIPRNLMGTYMAGAGILGSIVNFLTSVGIGGFMWVWATMFQPPAGEMVSVCLDKEMKQSQVVQLVRDAGLATPEGGGAVQKNIFVQPWYANGIVCDSGLCYEIRLRDADSETKRKQRDKLKNKVDLLDAKIKQKRIDGATDESLTKRETALAVIKEQHTTLDSILTWRADSWREIVVKGLGENIIDTNAEVLSRTPAMAVVATLPTSQKTKSEVLDKLNTHLQALEPSAIDLNVINTDRGFALTVSALLQVGSKPDEVIGPLIQRLDSIAAKDAPGLLSPRTSVPSTEMKPAVIMDIALVENPVRTFVSLITRCVNAVLSKFTAVPPPDQKLISLGRNVCKNDVIGHARASTLGGRNGLHMVVVPQSDTVGGMDAWTTGALAKIRTEAASLKLTVPKPVIEQGVVPIKYNYLSGNIYMFIMVLLGFGLVLYFLRKEKQGIVKKWGAEEMHLEKKQTRELQAAAAVAASGNPAANGPQGGEETYTPGYLVPKLIGMVVGLAVLSLGINEAWPNLRLLLKGTQTEAVAAAIVAKKPGQPDVTMKTQADVDVKTKAVSDARDYTWTFYNEFTFETKEGTEQTFCRNVGCKLKPTLPLLDEYGLPTTTMLYYDEADPTKTSVPHEYSTWLAPVLISLLGAIMLFVSTMLAWFARKPIVLSSADAINLT